MTKRFFIEAIDSDGQDYQFFNEVADDMHWSEGLGNVSIEETVRVTLQSEK
jgi:hypothetical protein